MTRSTVDFPAPLVPSSATVSPSTHVEVDAEEHLHGAVGEVDVAQLQHGDVVGAGLPAPLLVLGLADLLHDHATGRCGCSARR